MRERLGKHGLANPFNGLASWVELRPDGANRVSSLPTGWLGGVNIASYMKTGAAKLATGYSLDFPKLISKDSLPNLGPFVPKIRCKFLHAEDRGH